MMGEDPTRRVSEIAALREGLELGLTLIDTAEMYGDGAAEELIGEALGNVREDVFLVSKAYPHNASLTRLEQSCEASLARLRTDHLDLYLLHWRGSIPLAETVEAMGRLIEAGKILRWGVSNLDIDDMDELLAAGGSACATDQILYNPTRRGPELELIPWLLGRRMPIMAYSPIEQGRLVKDHRLQTIARQHDATPAQIALAWLLQRPGIIAIPKAGSAMHVRENRAAANIELSESEGAAIEAAFPRPTKRRPLEML